MQESTIITVVCVCSQYIWVPKFRFVSSFYHCIVLWWVLSHRHPLVKLTVNHQAWSFMWLVWQCLPQDRDFTILSYPDSNFTKCLHHVLHRVGTPCGPKKEEVNLITQQLERNVSWLYNCNSTTNTSDSSGTDVQVHCATLMHYKISSLSNLT